MYVIYSRYGSGVYDERCIRDWSGSKKKSEAQTFMKQEKVRG